MLSLQGGTMKTAYSNEERYGWSTSFRCFAEVIRAADFVAWAIFSLALVQFIVFTVMTLNQPIIDLWAFRPAQTAVSIPYMLRDGAWFAYVTPVLGEPWIVPFEFPFFQWCVALLVQITGAPIDACGRLVKMSGFAPFVVAGAAYTCAFVWKERQRLAANLIPLVLAGTTVLIPTLILMSWSKYSDHFMLQNPLAALLRFQNLTTWYLGSWADRWTVVLWDGTVRLRALPEALGVAWFAVLFGLLRVGPRHCWYWMALVALTAYLSAFLFFPTLHLNHHYYQVENAILLCAAAAIVSEGLRRRRRSAEAYLMLTAIVAGQLWTFYHKAPRTIAGFGDSALS
jgi:hypothetical protein